MTRHDLTMATPLHDAFQKDMDPLHFLNVNTDYYWAARWYGDRVAVWADDHSLTSVTDKPCDKIATLRDIVQEAEQAILEHDPCHVYLDDKRTPRTARSWTVIRTVAGFERHLIGYTPEVISFDHDLGEEGDVRNGLDACHLFVEALLARHVHPDDVEFNVHSANPVGADNIRRRWESYRRNVERFGFPAV